MEIRAPLVTKVDVPVTTLTALATLNPEQFPVLLDSAAQGPLARYSMAMFEPRAALLRDAQGRLTGNGFVPGPGGFIAIQRPDCSLQIVCDRFRADRSSYNQVVVE